MTTYAYLRVSKLERDLDKNKADRERRSGGSVEQSLSHGSICSFERRNILWA